VIPGDNLMPGYLGGSKFKLRHYQNSGSQVSLLFNLLCGRKKYKGQIKNMRYINSIFLFSASVVLLCASCTSNEIGNSKDVNPESIYFDYRVWGDEEAGYITTRLQYRFAGPSGTTLLLASPSKAELDGVAIKADSSKMNGAYYEVTKPVKEFTGRHSIVFTDRDGKQYKEEFSFQPISLKDKLPAAIKRGDLSFDLNGLAPEDYVKVMLTDTVSFSEGIDRLDTIKNGHIVITKEDLKKLASGHIVFEISKEDEKRIKNGTREGGKISIAYEVRREFELKD
jgi:hypothetical protein